MIKRTVRILHHVCAALGAVGFVVLALLATPEVQAQFPGTFPSGYIYGNKGASQEPAAPMSPTEWLDRWCGSVSGKVPLRSSSWGCGAVGTDIQAWDADLDALAALNSTGFPARTASNTWAQRSLAAPAAGFTITNPAGVAGNPTFVLANDLAALEALSSTGYGVRTTTDTWAQRTFQAGTGLSVSNGDGVSGDTTYAINDAELLALAGLTSANNKCFYWTGSGTAANFDCTSFGRSIVNVADAAAARTLFGSVIGTDVQAFDADLAALAANSTDGLWAHTGAGTGAARTLTAPAAGFTITNPAGVAGNPTFVLANDLAALEALSSTGYAVRTTTDTWAQRTFQSGTGLTVTNGDGVSGNTSYAITDAELLAIAGLTSAADTCFYFTGSGTAATFTCPSWARTFLATASTSAARTSLGVAIGSDVQAYSAILAGVVGAGNIADDKVFVGSGANTGDWKTMPDCGDTGGNHINYAQSTNAFSCGTSSSAGGGGGTPSDPQGRVTFVSVTPVMTAAQTAKTTIYYALNNGQYWPDPANSFTMTTFTELSMALDSNSGHTGYHQASKNFDLFIGKDSGTTRLCSGPTWNSGTAGSDTARGTGAGSTELERASGYRVNKNSMTCRYGSNSGDTFTCAADSCLKVGSFRTNGTDGQTAFDPGSIASGGGAASIFVCNDFNRVDGWAMVGDSTDSWSYATATWRAADNSTSMRATMIRCADEDAVSASYLSLVGSAGSLPANGICVDTTSQNSGATGPATAGATGSSIGTYAGLPGLGLHYIQACEIAQNAVTATFYGDNGNSGIFQGMLVVRFRY